MTYIIEREVLEIDEGDVLRRSWAFEDSFEDKELAEKKLRDLNRAWVASGNFRLKNICTEQGYEKL